VLNWLGCLGVDDWALGCQEVEYISNGCLDVEDLFSEGSCPDVDYNSYLPRQLNQDSCIGSQDADYSWLGCPVDQHQRISFGGQDVEDCWLGFPDD
jgi:hypothetical protein